MVRALVEPLAKRNDRRLIVSGPPFGMNQLRMEPMGVPARIRRAGKSPKHFAGHLKGLATTDIYQLVISICRCQGALGQQTGGSPNARP